MLKYVGLDVANAVGLGMAFLIGSALHLTTRAFWIVLIGAGAAYLATVWAILRRSMRRPDTIDRRSYDERFGRRWWH